MENTIGDRIAVRRKEYGMTQEDVAKAVGISRSQVASIENNISNPSLEFLTRFVNLTNTTYLHIIEGLEPHHSSEPLIPYSKLGEEPSVAWWVKHAENLEEQLKIYRINAQLFDHRVKYLEKEVEKLENENKFLKK